VWISPIFFSLFSLSFACVWGKSICALLPLLFRDEEEEGRVPRERLLGETIPAGFLFLSFVLSLSLSFEEEERKVCRRRNPKERSRIFGERVNQRDLIREEISSTESALNLCFFLCSYDYYNR